MIQNLTSIVSLGSLLILLYGVLQLITWPSPQECHMTYMFQYPQYTRIAVPQDADHPKYRLFTYSEGGSEEGLHPAAATRSPPHFTGSPVLFVHGNAGTHKQMRSFASVALRKSIDMARHSRSSGPHLDYFGVDYNEEFSALFGGYLQPQADYMAHCVHAISRLYAAPSPGIIIVAHSMGGKVAQAALMHSNVSALVHTVLMLATPVDRPVIDVDFFTSAFYKRIDAYWEQHRLTKWVATNETATCCREDDDERQPQVATAPVPPQGVPSALLDHVLLVTIGGGARDRLVHAGLTASRFSDVHAMSTAIPDVWLSTDHLCSVWCLQQVLVINRFLFEIVDKAADRTKSGRLLVARRYFSPEKLGRVQRTVQLFEAPASNDAAAFPEPEWQQDSRLQFVKSFAHGSEGIYTQMIALKANAPEYRYLDVELVDAPLDEQAGWLFLCRAQESNAQSRYCSSAERLDGYAKRIPSRANPAGGGQIVVLQLDLQKLVKGDNSYTHLLIRTAPSSKAFQIRIDQHGERRIVNVQMPKWYSFSWSAPIYQADGFVNTVRLQIAGLVESYQSLEVEVTSPNQASCRRQHVTADVCVPWTEGFGRFHHFVNQSTVNLLVDVPTDKPHNYNTTDHPVTVDFHLQKLSTCPLTIRVRNSFARTAANIVQLFAHWLPAHLAAVLLLGFKQQITVTPKNEAFKCAGLVASIVRSSSFFIITASRVFVKLIQWTKVMPPLDGYEHSMVVSVLCHGAAVALIVLLQQGVNGVVCGGGAVLLRVRQCCGGIVSPGVRSVLVKLPAVVGTVLLGSVLSTCGGLALIVACGLYLVIMIDLRKSYLLQLQEVTESAKTPDSDADETTTTTDNGESLPEEQPPNDDDAPKSSADDEDAALPSAVDVTEQPEATTTDTQSTSDATPSTQALDSALGMTDEERRNDEELNRLIRETMEQRKNGPAVQPATEEAKRRAEYELMDVRRNALHFHSALFVALVVLTLLNLPSVLAWTRDIPFSYSLAADPSFIPASVSILALVVLWQLNAPRQINGYSTIGSLLYMMAALCILYGQDSVYRLNAFITATFVCLAAHQWLTPLYVPSDESADGSLQPKRAPLTPTEIDEMLEKIMAAERVDRAQRGEDVDEEDGEDDVDEDGAADVDDAAELGEDFEEVEKPELVEPKKVK